MTLSSRRLLYLSAFLSTWIVVVVCRLFQVQILRHDDYVLRAQRQQERTLTLAPVRGSIRDARGRILAESVTAESVYADPQAVVNPVETARSLAVVKGIGVSQKEIERKLRARNEFAWIARQLSPEIAASVKSLKLAGIYTLEEHRRAYPKSALAASLLGYVSLDGEGLGGAERSLDRYVRGRAGKVTLLRDARRGMYMVGGEGKNKPVDGTHVILTIDEVVQYLTERALQKAVDQYGAQAGSAIVMDPHDGSILAMASYPTFDPNHFRDFPPAAWRNRGVQDLYEPGSTFKIITASAALEEGIVTPSQVIDCGTGSIEIAHVKMREHGGNKYGLMTFEDVLAKSSNVGTIKVGLALGPRRFFRYISGFGFGRRTGIELPGEASGILRRTEQWSQLSNAAISIGQEIGVTPLQIVTATAAVANGGKRVHPHVLDRVVNSEGETLFRTPLPDTQQVISPKTAAVLNEILKVVVSRGTGQNAALLEHVVAGKTGTAQKAGRGGYTNQVVASFTGYVPADRPRLVIIVTVDEPRKAQYGGTIAAPVFKEIAEGALRYLGVPPSLPGRSLQLIEPKLALFTPRSQSPMQAQSVPAAVSSATAASSGRTVKDAIAAVQSVPDADPGVGAAQGPASSGPQSGRGISR